MFRYYKIRPFHRIFLIIAVTVAPISSSAGTLENVDSLLKRYDKSHAKERIALGKQLLNIYEKGDALLFSMPEPDSRMPKDSVDLMVWFGANRFYTSNALFSEALTYNNRALPLAVKGHSDIHATLLCDKCYCQFKTGDYTEAIQTGKEAIHVSQRYNDRLSLSRAYLYI